MLRKSMSFMCQLCVAVKACRLLVCCHNISIPICPEFRSMTIKISLSQLPPYLPFPPFSFLWLLSFLLAVSWWWGEALQGAKPAQNTIQQRRASFFFFFLSGLLQSNTLTDSTCKSDTADEEEIAGYLWIGQDSVSSDRITARAHAFFLITGCFLTLSVKEKCAQWQICIWWRSIMFSVC